MKDKQTIYLLSGVLGAGKTSLAHKLNKVLGCALVDGDAIFVPLENVENLDWEKRLNIFWKNIVCLAKNYVSEGFDVVIDFAGEVKLNWFVSKIQSDNIVIKYAVLIADEKVLKQRLENRDGSDKYLKRSLVILEQLSTNPENKKYLIDTSDKNTNETLVLVTSDDKFIVG